MVLTNVFEEHFFLKYILKDNFLTETVVSTFNSFLISNRIKFIEDLSWSELTVIIKNLMSSWVMISLMVQSVAAALIHEYNKMEFRKHLYYSEVICSAETLARKCITATK